LHNHRLQLQGEEDGANKSRALGCYGGEQLRGLAQTQFSLRFINHFFPFFSPRPKENEILIHLNIWRESIPRTVEK
jgi:hypothetical protein